MANERKPSQVSYEFTVHMVHPSGYVPSTKDVKNFIEKVVQKEIDKSDVYDLIHGATIEVVPLWKRSPVV